MKLVVKPKWMSPDVQARIKVPSMSPVIPREVQERARNIITVKMRCNTE